MMYEHEATVEVRGRFPVDMLRYDCCCPMSGEDVNAIVRSLESYPDKPYQVTLRALSHSKARWTVARWRSFGAIVVTTAVRKVKA